MEHHSVSYHNIGPELFAATDALIADNREVLKSYIDQLLWWNERINLISRNASRETLWDHIRHSLLLSQFEVFKKRTFLVDAGTGGGLPGIPLAIVCPEKHFILNDIVRKKVFALKQMKKRLQISNITCQCASIDEINSKNNYLLISKHAFKIDELYLMFNQMPFADLVFYKGSDFEKELESITDPLTIIAYDLFSGTENQFYENKKIVVVHR